MTRYAVIESKNTRWDDSSVVAKYLPENFKIIGEVIEQEHVFSCVAPAVNESFWIVVAGEDDHGWTLDGYVIPRLSSGMIWATEVQADDPRVVACLAPA